MRKNKLILLLIILFLMIFICLAIKINRADNLSENKKEVDEYEQTIIKLVDIEQSKEKEEAIVKIIDADANTIFITNKDIE